MQYSLLAYTIWPYYEEINDFASSAIGTVLPLPHRPYSIMSQGFLVAKEGSAESLIKAGTNEVIGGRICISAKKMLEGKEPEEGNIRRTTWQAMRDFNTRLASGKHFDAVMLPTAEGLSIAIRKDSAING